MSRLALDIETVSPTVPHDEYPDFQDPNDFEMLGVGLSTEYEDGSRETDVLFREDSGDRAEEEVLRETISRLEESDAETVLTYNGSDFDFIHLLGRSKIQAGAGSELVSRYEDWLDSVTHVDLKPPAWDAWGQYTSFEEACANAGVSVEPTHVDDYEIGIGLRELSPHASDGPELSNADVPIIGEELLTAMLGAPTDLDREETWRLLYDYTVADLHPLFELADAQPFK